MPARTLLLLSCSRDKRQGGAPVSCTARQFPSRNTVPKRSEHMFSTRRKILGYLHGDPRPLYNEDQQGGLRRFRSANRDLTAGPDFGVVGLPGIKYMPAHARYAGRFFTSLLSARPNFWQELPGTAIEILFVSGLYGLLFWDELIQDYDCHLADYVSGYPERTVGKIWSDIVPAALVDFLQCQKSLGRPIRFVYDLLSEEAYQGVFDWSKIESNGVLIWHRVFQGIAGPDTLPCIANILSASLARFGDGDNRFTDGPRYQCGDGDGGRVTFGFERRIGAERWATREGEMEAARKRLLAECPSLGDLPSRVFEMLAKAEHSWSKVRPLRQFDFGAVIVSFTKAVECYFREIEPECPQGAFGLVIGYLGSRPRWRHIVRDLEELNTLRRSGGAHPGEERTKIDLQSARSLALDVISRAELVRTGGGSGSAQRR